MATQLSFLDDEPTRDEYVTDPTAYDPTADLDRAMQERSQREGYPEQPEPGYEPEPPPDPKNAPPKNFYPLADTANWRRSELQQYPSWLRDIIRTTPIDPINPRGEQPNPHDVPIIPIDPAGNMRYEPMLGAGDEQLIAQDWPGVPEPHPSELPSPPRPGRGFLAEAFQPEPAGTDPMSLKPTDLIRQLRQGIISDADLAAVKRDPTSLQSLGAYAQGAIMLSRGAGRGENLNWRVIPGEEWAGWKEVQSPMVGQDPGKPPEVVRPAVRQDPQGDYYEWQGTHVTQHPVDTESGRSWEERHHVIAQPVEGPTGSADWKQRLGQDKSSFTAEDKPSEEGFAAQKQQKDKPVSHLSSDQMDQFMKWVQGDHSAYPGDEIINKLKKTNGPSLWDHYQYQKRNPGYKPPTPPGPSTPGDVREGEEWKHDPDAKPWDNVRWNLPPDDWEMYGRPPDNEPKL